MIIYFVGHKNVINVDFICYIKLKGLKKKIPFEIKGPIATAFLSCFKSHSQCPVRCFTLSDMGRLINTHWCVIGPLMWPTSP